VSSVSFRRLRRGVIAAIVAPVVLAMVSCGSSSGDSGSSAAGGSDAISIGVAEINLSLPFYVQMRQGSEAIAEDYGVDVTWQSADASIEKQISIIENYIAQEKDAILIDPINADALIDVINKATDAGIPVVTMGNEVKGESNHNTLYPDFANWEENARIIGNKLGGEGKVLLLTGTVGNYVSDTRQKGFEDVMAAEFPGIQVITQTTDFDSTKAGSVTQTVLANNPDLAAVASITDGVTLAAMKVLEQQGKTIPVITNDGDQDTYTYIDDGTIVSNILTGAERVGAWNTAVAARLAQGSTFDTNLYMPTYFVSSDLQASLMSQVGVEWVSTDEAITLAQNYVEEFGASRSDADMTVGA